MYSFELERKIDGIYSPRLSFLVGKGMLYGEETLKYARMRKDDPRGDLGRQKRQRNLLFRMMEKGTDISSVPKIKSILTVIEDHVCTNFQLKDVCGPFNRTTSPPSKR